MKKMIMILGFLLNIIGSTLLANTDGEVNKFIQNAFKKQFPKAQFVSWTTVTDQDMYMVRFVNNDQALVAYLGIDGELLATARAAMPAALPMPVTNLLSQEYSSYTLIESVELVLHGELSYVVTIESRKKRLTLMVHSNGMAREVKKEKIKPANL